MSRPFRVEWSDGTKKVTSCDAVTSLLQELHRKFAEHPELVDIVAPSGAVLTVGLGAKAAVLSYAESPDRPPYYASRGNGAGDGTIWFEYHGSPSEFPMRRAVSVINAVRGAEEFCKTGSRPISVEWESV
jgi:hypothetical protein